MELAELVGLTPSAIRQIEAGKIAPSEQTKRALARALRVRTYEIEWQAYNWPKGDRLEQSVPDLTKHQVGVYHAIAAVVCILAEGPQRFHPLVDLVFVRYGSLGSPFRRVSLIRSALVVLGMIGVVEAFIPTGEQINPREEGTYYRLRPGVEAFADRKRLHWVAHGAGKNHRDFLRVVLEESLRESKEETKDDRVSEA